MEYTPRLPMLLFLALALLSRVIHAKCGTGCLRCNQDGDCLLCDQSRYYFLNSFSNCVLNEIPNCLKTTIDGTCLLCDINFYLDTVQNECIQMPMANRINRCLYYSDLFNCAQCEEFFFVSDNACREVKKNILNCIKYRANDEKVCLICKEGFVVSHDGSSCIETVKIENCASYTVQSCLNCKPGSFSNQSAYLGSLKSLNNENAISTFTDYTVSNSLKILDAINFFQCELVLVSNCQVAKTIYECVVCEEGYFLGSSGECFPNPSEAVDYCIRYQAQDHCLECQQGYYPEKNNQCSLIPKIENCEEYSQTSPKCQICKSAFFLNGDKCEKRQVSFYIDLCVERSLTADSCSECQSGFVPTDDGLKCLVIIPNCETYEVMNQTFKTALCYRCKEGFYLDTDKNECVFPSVRDHGCKIFQRAFSRCEVCQDGYFLDSQSNCLKHNQDLISLACAEASSSEINTCSKCNDGYTLFGSTTTCQLITNPISFCKVYKTQEDCLTCEEGYYAPECLAIPASENCLVRKYLDTKCETCKKNYFLNSLGECVLPDDSVGVGCQTIEINSNDTFTCKACQSGFFFKKFEQTYICMSDTGNIDNCIRYKEDSSVTGGYACERCQDGYVLDKDTMTCKNSCPSDRPMLIKQSILNDRISEINTCFTQGAFSGCRVAALPHFDMTGSFDMGCASCELNFFPYIDYASNAMTLTSYHGFDFSGLITDLSISAVSRMNFVKCSSLTELDTKNLTTNATPSTGCQLYAVHNDKYVCIKCAHGHSGIIKKYDSATDDFVWGISSCVEIPDCVSEITSYRGIGWELGATKLSFGVQNFLTCPVCSGNKIPFLHMSLTTPSKLQNYDITLDQPSNTEDGTGMSVVCRDPSDPAQFGRTSAITVTANCGVAIWKINDDRSVVETANPYYCISCKPGFAATFSTDVGLEWSITSCDQIANCDSLKGGEWFSSCSKCASGRNWTHFIDSTKGYINYALCTENTNGDTNCQIVDASGNCLMCREEAFLNEDNVCEKYYSTDCSQGFAYKWLGESDSAQPDYAPEPEKLPLIYEPLGMGCTHCGNSKESVYQASPLYTCTFSDYIAEDSYPQGSVFIPYCVNFSYDNSNNRHTCNGCKSEFRLIEDGSKCISKSIEVGCQVYANNETGCIQCEEGYTTFNSKCFLNNIANCVDYSVESNKLTCLTCANTYYILDGKCLSGEVDNCLEYYSTGDPSACKTCQDKYALFYTSENKAICLNFDNDSQRTYCNKWNTLTYGEKFYCSECQFGYTLVENLNLSEFSNNVCIGPVKMINCLRYDIQSEPKNSSYKCVECVDGYYVNKGICSKRVTISQCVSFVIDEDLCQGCNSGYFLADDQKSCVAFPQGIQGCEQYQSESQCRVCKPGFYLQHERCVAVETENLVPFCSYYDTEQVCYECESGFFLKQKKCEKANVLNCSEYQDKDNCKICDEPFGLTLIDGKAQCVNKEIPFCTESTNYYPFKCISCQNGYFSNYGICEQITKTIDYCIMYDSADTCRFCDETSTLSKDSKECIKDEKIIKSVDSSCLFNSIVAPICNTCDMGYYLQENKCQLCQGKAALEQGCAYCDPQHPDECWLCRSGYYYVGSTGACEKETDPNDGSSDSVAVMRTAAVWVLLSILAISRG